MLKTNTQLNLGFLSLPLWLDYVHLIIQTYPNVSLQSVWDLSDRRYISLTEYLFLQHFRRLILRKA